MEGRHPDSFGARDTLEVGGRALEIFRLERAGRSASTWRGCRSR